MSSSPTAPQTSQPRRRNKRACDACRVRRIKCVTAPTGDVCKQCLYSSLTCERQQPPPEDTRHRSKRFRGKRKAESGPEGSRTSINSRTPASGSQGLEPRYLGPTSLSTLIESAIEACTNRSRRELAGGHENSYFPVVMSLSGEQAILVAQDGEHDQTEEPEMDEDLLDVFRLDRNQVAATVASQTVILALLQSYATHFLPYYPVVSLAELCSLEPALSLAFPFGDLQAPPTALPDPLAKLAICSLAALSRKVPRKIMHSLHHSLRLRMNGLDGLQLLRTSCLGSVQVLLLLGVNSELHSRSVSAAGGLSWMSVGTAIKMAQNLGLHRDLSTTLIPLHQLHRRRRIWGAVLTADRWYSISQGQPMSIDLGDCDLPLPRHLHDHDTDVIGQSDQPYLLHVEITKLSILLGRVIRCAYGPLGVSSTTDMVLHDLQNDLQSWLSDLPEDLKFRVNTQNRGAGILHMMFNCVNFAFLRSFLHSKKPIPPHLSFRPSPDAWANIVLQSGLAIEWCRREGSFLMDIWFIAHYALTWCFLIQLHDYTYTGKESSLSHMNMAVQCFQDWATGERGEPGWRQMLRPKVAGFISFLHDAAEQRLSTAQDSGAGTGPGQTTGLGDTAAVAADFPPLADFNSLMPSEVFDGIDFDFFNRNIGDLFDWTDVPFDA